MTWIYMICLPCQIEVLFVQFSVTCLSYPLNSFYIVSSFVMFPSLLMLFIIVLLFLQKGAKIEDILTNWFGNDDKLLKHTGYIQW